MQGIVFYWCSFHVGETGSSRGNEQECQGDVVQNAPVEGRDIREVMKDETPEKLPAARQGASWVIGNVLGASLNGCAGSRGVGVGDVWVVVVCCSRRILFYPEFVSSRKTGNQRRLPLLKPDYVQLQPSGCPGVGGNHLHAGPLRTKFARLRDMPPENCPALWARVLRLQEHFYGVK